MSRAPLTKASELEGLDMDEMIEGYWDGRAGDKEPGDNRSLSYWHGWRNGMTDGGHAKPDDAQMLMAASYIASLTTRP